MDNSNANPKQQLLERLKSSTNILVTVSANPSVDQLAACIGLTLWLNKLGKHGTAVFSGMVPNTLEFLQPEATLEKNTDSLRDFIIALDKSKADKLRYKVEDRVVKIFITPYRTSLSAEDLEFSQGDFNVDMVIAIGVTAQEDLDLAITAHGRILHDATVTTITTSPDSQLGSINWADPQASSLCELIVDLGNDLDRTQLDGQIATALLTGIVAETERFSNQKTTPITMNISAELMSVGANQQLVASKLDEPAQTAPATSSGTNESSDQPTGDQALPPTDTLPEPPKQDDGTLEIVHPETDAPANDESTEAAAEAVIPVAESMTMTDAASTTTQAPPTTQQQESSIAGPKLITEPPTLGGTLTANSRPDDEKPEPSSDPLSMPAVEAMQPLLNHDASPAQAAPANAAEAPTEPAAMQPAPADWMPPVAPPAPADETPVELPAPETALPMSPVPPPPSVPDETAPSETLSQIEQAVESPHLDEAPLPEVDLARDEVNRALSAAVDTNPEPIEALNAQTIDLNTPPSPVPEPAAPPAPADGSSMSFDPNRFEVANDPEAPTSTVDAHTDPIMPVAPPPSNEAMTGPTDQAFTMPLPPTMPPASQDTPIVGSGVLDPTAPPPVPPPLPPSSFSQ